MNLFTLFLILSFSYMPFSLANFNNNVPFNAWSICFDISVGDFSNIIFFDKYIFPPLNVATFTPLLLQPVIKSNNAKIKTKLLNTFVVIDILLSIQRPFNTFCQSYYLKLTTVIEYRCYKTCFLSYTFN